MAINQEIEYKQLLSEDQYNEIKKAFSVGKNLSHKLIFISIRLILN